MIAHASAQTHLLVGYQMTIGSALAGKGEHKMNDKVIYKNIIIRTIETRLAMAKQRGINELNITVDVVDDILSILKDQQNIVQCKDCKWRNTKACFCKSTKDVRDDWFCSECEHV